MNRDGLAPVDVLVVGSGASAVNAAYPVVEAGWKVRLLDFGNRDPTYEALVPARPFSEIRRSDSSQHRYFLGERFEGLPFGQIGMASQVTPPRQYVFRDSETLTPVVSDSFFAVESLAVGGLASAWGAGCPPFDDEDLRGLPISRADLEPHYEAVAERIGISGARDDLLPLFGDLTAMQPAVQIDTNGRSILERYRRRSESFRRAGFHLGQPRLALLSQPHRGREATRYHDMDFWSDAGRSVYRPRWTLEELQCFGNFEYKDGVLVSDFAEADAGELVVRAKNVRTGEIERHRARALILAAGTLGTARIVLRSLGRYDWPVPLVCNPHTYAPMLNLNMLGRDADDMRHSLAQLCVAYRDPDGGEGVTVGHLYSYRSLLTFRLLKELPLAHRDSLRIFRLLIPCLAILLLQHADRPTPEKYCVLRHGENGGPDRLEIGYALSATERQRADKIELAVLRGFRRLGCICLRRVHPGHAASIHYAGAFPMTVGEEPLTTDADGRLRPTTSVYLADGSVFPRLPSKGLTFTMMANANRVGCQVRGRLNR